MSNQPPPLSLTVRTGPQPGQTFIVREGANSIGRDPARDIYLPEQSISRNHARIMMQPDGVWIEDLGSRNGTFVNGQRITAPTRLNPGDTLQIGTTVTLMMEPQAAPPQAPPPDATFVPDAGPTAASWGLVVQSGPQAGQLFPLVSGPQMIGRGPGNQIVIPDPSISKYHAQVNVQPEGIWIQDVGSANGTFVNDQRITAPTWLKPGDKVQVGISLVLGLQAVQPGVVPPAVPPPAMAPGATVRPVVSPLADTITPPARRRTWPWVATAAVALLVILAALAAAAWFFWWRPIPEPLPGPAVMVYEPESEADTAINEPLFIHASARDEQRVSYAELWADGELVAAQPSSLPEGLTPFTFVPIWSPSTTGRHDFFVRAYSTDGRVGQSNLVGVNAFQVSAESDALVYVAQEGDTIESIAEEVEVSTEEIIALNPAVEEVAKTENVPPEKVAPPPGVPVVVPPKANPAKIPTAQPVKIPPQQQPQQQQQPMALTPKKKTIPMPPSSCLQRLSPRAQELVVEIELTAPGYNLKDILCHGVIGITPAWKLDMSGVKSFKVTTPLVSKPLPVMAGCYVKGVPPSTALQHLGFIDNTIMGKDNWQEAGGQFVQSGSYTSIGGTGGNFTVKYRICPAPGPCPKTLAGGQPPVKLGLFKSVRIPPWSWNIPGGPILTWSWGPNAPFALGHQVCFEVYERVCWQGGGCGSRRLAVHGPTEIKGGDIWPPPVRLPKQFAQGGCGTQTTYIVWAFGSDGSREKAEFPLAALPPCPQTATVSFDRLRATGGDIWATYSIGLFVNTAQSVRPPFQPGPPHAGGNTYDFAKLSLNKGNIFNVQLGPNDNLDIWAVVLKRVATGWDTWCMGTLSLTPQEVAALANKGPTGKTLNTVTGTCQVEISVQVP